LLGEDLLLGLRQQVFAVAADVAQVVGAELPPLPREQLLRALVVHRRRPPPASSSSTRSSSSAAHSSSKNTSVVWIAVSCSWTRCSSAPLAGSAVSVEKRSAA